MNTSHRSWLHWQMLALIGGVYALSFFLPAVTIPIRVGPTTVDGRVVDPGVKVLPIQMTGAAAFGRAVDQGMAPLSRAGVAWFANPVLWLGGALLALRKDLLAGFAGVLAAALILVTYVLDRLGSGDKVAYFVGFWLWLSSAVLLSATGFALRLRNRSVQAPSAPGAG